MNRIVSFLCICFFLSLSACSLHDSSETRQAAELPELSCVAVLPTAVPVTSNGTVSKAREESLREGAAFLDTVLAEKLGSQSEFKVLTENHLDAILDNPWGGRIRQVRDVGRATGCGGVLETSISRYRHRVGGEMSIETAAAASFSIELIGVEQGIVLWSTSFDEEQKALLENIFSFKKAESRGFKWLSVQDLCRDGVNRRLAEFPYFQKDEI